MLFAQIMFRSSELPVSREKERTRDPIVGVQRRVERKQHLKYPDSLLISSMTENQEFSFLIQHSREFQESISPMDFVRGRLVFQESRSRLFIRNSEKISFRRNRSGLSLVPVMDLILFRDVEVPLLWETFPDDFPNYFLHKYLKNRLFGWIYFFPRGRKWFLFPSIPYKLNEFCCNQTNLLVRIT